MMAHLARAIPIDATDFPFFGKGEFSCLAGSIFEEVVFVVVINEALFPLFLARVVIIISRALLLGLSVLGVLCSRFKFERQREFCVKRSHLDLFDEVGEIDDAVVDERAIGFLFAAVQPQLKTLVDNE